MIDLTMFERARASFELLQDDGYKALEVPPEPIETPTPVVPDAPVQPVVPDPGTPGDPAEPPSVPPPDEPPQPVNPDQHFWRQRPGFVIRRR
jgi:hypothetical protein